MIGRVARKIAPTLEIMREEVVRVIAGNNMRMAGINEGERATRRTDIHRLPETVKHQNLTV